jgi:hypothetical protein
MFDLEGDSEPWKQQVFDVLRPALPYLTSLEIHTTFAVEGPGVEKDSELFCMIKRECISLHQLSVCASNYSKCFLRYIIDVLEVAPMDFEFRLHAQKQLVKYFYSNDCDAWIDNSHDM